MKASIIIPTHNRVDSLLRTLNSVCELNFPKKDYEIIIVENVCTDGTKYKVEQWIKENRLENMKLLSERSAGVHHARNSGAIAAKSEILIFIDDDVVVTSNLLNAYLSSFNKNPKMVAAGGAVLPKWESRPPKWLTNFIGKRKTFFILGLMNPHNKFQLKSKGFFFSNNMVIRRKILLEMGGFNPELVGTEYIGNGETGLYKKLWKKNLLIGYIPNALVYHHLPKDRLTLSYLKRRMVNEGISNMYTHYHEGTLRRTTELFTKLLIIAISNLKLWLADFVYNGRTDINSLNIQLEAARFRGQIKFILN